MLIALGKEPSPRITKLIEENGAFFATTLWQQHLARSFNLESLYFHDPDVDDGFVVQVFRRGPVRLAYLNFPTGGSIRNLEPTLENVEAIQAQLKKHSIARLRIRQSAFRAPRPLAYESTIELETAIPDLQSYESSSVKKIKRSLSRASRFGVTVNTTPEVSARYLFDTYALAVRRNKGRLRYPKKYFSSLLRLHEAQNNLQLLVAQKGKRPLGFIVSATSSGAGYYLHGGVNADAGKYHVSELLIDFALSISRNRGAELYNLMASPPKQPSLVKFKEKFTGVTRQQHVYDITINPFWNRLVKLAERVY